MANPMDAMALQQMITSTIKSAESVINNWQTEKTKRKAIEAELTKQLQIINRNYDAIITKMNNKHEETMYLLKTLTDMLKHPKIQENPELYIQTLTFIGEAHAKSLDSTNYGAIEGTPTKYIGQNSN